MKTRVMLTILTVLFLIPASGMAITAYTQDFEGMDSTNINALGDDGWLVYANVFGPDWSYWYGYGAFPAPNDGAAFCAIVTDEGGAEQGSNQLSVYSDYNNVDHANGGNIQSLVFREQTVEASNVGETWEFHFHAKMGNLAGASTAAAFIKTLNPAAGWATTNEILLDMTAISADWNDYTISLTINSSLVGQIFQIGFLNVATAYEPSAVIYDNIDLVTEGTVSTTSASWDGVKSLYR